MARFKRFTFVVNEEERALITALAEHLRRSQSDAVRFVVIEEAKRLLEMSLKAHRDKRQILDPPDLRRWRTELPNLYDDLGLDVYEFRLLAHYKRVGNCFESVVTIAKKCGMSTGKVSETRAALAKRRLINMDANKYGGFDVTVRDIWEWEDDEVQTLRQNFQKSSSLARRARRERR